MTSHSKLVLAEAKRLHLLAWGIHWLRPKSKIPVEGSWGSGPRKSWDYLRGTYVEGFNIGVRLGTPSKIADGYLAVIDVDIKSKDPNHRAEAIRALGQIVPREVLSACAKVHSGRGGGSGHYYCQTAKPFKTWDPARSSQMVKYHSPSKTPSKVDRAGLTEKEISEGFRMGPAWEISLYSDGRQVVLPPSVHPDSGELYAWARKVDDLPMVEFPVEAASPTKESIVALDGFEPEDVELSWLPLPKNILMGIVDGTGVSDRSSYLLPATTALHSAGLTRNEILSVLTDPNYFLSECAYEHAQTKSRRRAAEWLWKFTVAKVMNERDAAKAFAGVEVAPRVKLSGEALAKQNRDFASDKDWRDDLSRSGDKGKGPPRSTIENVVLILTNTVAQDVVKRDEFACRDAFSLDTPWGSKKGSSVSDDDIPRIIHYMGQRWSFEPKDASVWGALTVIACRNAFDPIRDTLNGLPQWDGTPRLSTWLSEHFEAEGDPKYLDQVFTKWMCAIVRRTFEPGAKFDWMPILEGPQGRGKSAFGRILVGDKYFLDWLPNLADKDSMAALQGHWIVELSELSQFKRNEIESIKSFITRTVDKFRPSHGRKLAEFNRRCVFFGTTNRATYLIDDTGNRRFKPIKVGRLDFETLREEREQLFAEAVHLYKTVYTNDLSFELTGTAREFEVEIHAEKMLEDDSISMYEQLLGYIRENSLKNEVLFDFDSFQLTDLFKGEGCLKKWVPTIRNMQFAAKAVKRLGGKSWKSHGRMVWKITKREGFKVEQVPDDFL